MQRRGGVRGARERHVRRRRRRQGLRSRSRGRLDRRHPPGGGGLPEPGTRTEGNSVSDEANREDAAEVVGGSSYTAPDLTLIGQSHIDAYEATDGEEGYLWNGATCLILRTTGAKSGEPRKSALIYAAHTANGDDAYVLIASQGGAPTHPNWYHNLVAHPDAEVQVKGDIIPVRARTAE